MRGALSWCTSTLVALVLVATAAPARAQLCHDLPELEADHAAGHALASGDPAHAEASAPADAHAHAHAHAHGDRGGVHLIVGVRAEAATAAIDRRPIDYQGTSVRLDAHWRSLHLRAQGSWYRVRDTLDVDTGPGDLMLAAMWTAYQSARVHAGIALPVGAPLGDQATHLGMGHWMVMPGLFAALRVTDAVSASAGVAYNRALGASGHHNHGIGPYVNPMTAEEYSVASRLTVRASSAIQLLAESALAAPTEGSMRMIVGAGFSVQLEGITLGVLAQAGALHAPFTSRGVADISYAF